MKAVFKTLAASLALIGGGTIHAAPAQPPLVAKASELSALPGGGWLTIDKHGLHLLAADGSERAHLALRAKQLDTRAANGITAQRTLAIVIDANTEQVVPVLADPAAGTLQASAPIPAPGWGTGVACLFRDAQQIDYIFQSARDGQAEQWLLKDGVPQLVRKLALPPHVKHCRTDDATATLFVSEPDLGLWAYNADPEDGGSREPVALRAPFGKLSGGAGAIAVRADGVEVEDATSHRHIFHRGSGAWHSGAARKTPAAMQAPAIVMARAQTEPMPRLGDAADDPAIWVNPRNPADSRVLGTNKKQGLLVYDMQGRQTQLLESGRLNNVDLRQNVDLGGVRGDFALATQRDENSMVLYAIASDGEVSEAARFPTPLERIYGTCVYQPKNGGLEVFINDKDGSFLQYRIAHNGGAYTSTLLRRFKTASQPEGCVADDRTGRLFLGEEKRGVWSISADGDGKESMHMILPVGGIMTADVEGMSIYHGANASYLVVSSQGSSSYVVLDAAAPHKVRGSFRIGINLEAGIDGTSETDGLDVTSANLGGPFAQGMLVVQDGHKRLPDGPQNFKYVSWEDVARALNLR
ncbi:phytase [Pseudoduganella sp. RAF19]|uniref:phytase n=1 Tax=Pseudoduganella sp. RAF19 TaxID=3233052 RepID=UPI003F9C676B